MHTLQQVTIEPGVLVAYKIFPGTHFVTSQAQLGQSLADWSGLYGQFNLQHAVAYLPNHFDRGHESAMLISITTRLPTKCIIYSDARFCETTVSSSDKATALQRSIKEHYPSFNTHERPLLQTIGNELQSIVVMYDAEDLECAIPHGMLNDENFVFQTHAIIERNPTNPWMVKSVAVVNNQLNVDTVDFDADFVDVALSKDERADMKMLGMKLENYITPNCCQWIDAYTYRISQSASSSLLKRSDEMSMP